jgi:hypothetical protein
MIQLSSMQAWDEGLELRWNDSGNGLIFLRLANKISHVAEGQN